MALAVSRFSDQVISSCMSYVAPLLNYLVGTFSSVQSSGGEALSIKNRKITWSQVTVNSTDFHRTKALGGTLPTLLRSGFKCSRILCPQRANYS